MSASHDAVLLCCVLLGCVRLNCAQAVCIRSSLPLPGPKAAAARLANRAQGSIPAGWPNRSSGKACPRRPAGLPDWPLPCFRGLLGAPREAAKPGCKPPPKRGLAAMAVLGPADGVAAMLAKGSLFGGSAQQPFSPREFCWLAQRDACNASAHHTRRMTCKTGNNHTALYLAVLAHLLAC